MDRELDQLLNAYWLRPETALWRCLDIQAMRGFEFRAPSLDFGCGDGVFSFIRAGGEFAADFDVFKATADLDKFFAGADVYDAFDATVTPSVTRLPDYRIDVAFDHKANLLRKAAALGLYRECREGDGNRPLPFADSSFASIFSNIIYWLSDPGAAFRELARILRSGGELCLMLPNVTLREFSFYHALYVTTGNPKWRFLERLDRGRLADNVKTAKTAAEWEALFADAGLRVKRHSRHLSRPIVQLWDIGMRPLFPVLKKMTDAIGGAEMPAIKAEWIAIFRQFLEPLLMLDSEPHGVEPAFHCYVLEK